jgi:hypothetical protein
VCCLAVSGDDGTKAILTSGLGENRSFLGSAVRRNDTHFAGDTHLLERYDRRLYGLQIAVAAHDYCYSLHNPSPHAKKTNIQSGLYLHYTFSDRFLQQTDCKLSVPVKIAKTEFFQVIFLHIALNSHIGTVENRRPHIRIRHILHYPSCIFMHIR